MKNSKVDVLILMFFFNHSITMLSWNVLKSFINLKFVWNGKYELYDEFVYKGYRIKISI